MTDRAPGSDRARGQSSGTWSRACESQARSPSRREVAKLRLRRIRAGRFSIRDGREASSGLWVRVAARPGRHEPSQPPDHDLNPTEFSPGANLAGNATPRPSAAAV